MPACACLPRARRARRRRRRCRALALMLPPALALLLMTSTADTGHTPSFEVHPNISACHQLDHEGGKLPWGVPSAGELKYLGVAATVGGCNAAAATWKNASAPYERCLSACWYHSPWNSSYERQCYCNVAPTWMPLPSSQADSSVISWPCEGPSDCSYNGVCSSAADGDGALTCVCNPAWGGVRCGELNLLPVDSKLPGYREVRRSDPTENVSTWGAPILFDEASGKWHGWASEMTHGCGKSHSRGSNWVLARWSQCRSPCRNQRLGNKLANSAYNCRQTNGTVHAHGCLRVRATRWCQAGDDFASVSDLCCLPLSFALLPVLRPGALVDDS